MAGAPQRHQFTTPAPPDGYHYLSWQTFMDLSYSQSAAKRLRDVVHALSQHVGLPLDFAGAYIAGGAIISAALGRYSKDIDVFFATPEAEERYLSRLDALIGDTGDVSVAFDAGSQTSTGLSKQYKVTYPGPDGLPRTQQVEAVMGCPGSPDVWLDNFDIDATQWAADTRHVLVSVDALDALFARTFSIIRDTTPERAKKYWGEKGLMPPRGYLDGVIDGHYWSPSAPSASVPFHADKQVLTAARDAVDVAMGRGAK